MLANVFLPISEREPFPDIRAHSGLSCRSSCQNELNDNAEGVLRAAAEPGLAIEPPTSPDSRSSRDDWLPKPRHDLRPRADRLIACVRTSPPTRSNCPRWHASAQSNV